MSSKEASDWLGQRLGEQRKQVEASEQALQQYREQTDSVSLEDKQNIVVQKLADLNAAVTRAKTERIQKEALYNQIAIAAGRSGGARHVPGDSHQHLHPAAEGRAGRPAAAAGAAVAEARPAPSRHGEDRPRRSRPPRRSFRAKIAKVVQSTRNDYQAAQAQEQSLVERARAAEARRAGAQPQGHRLRRAAARRRQQPADLRQPDAAHEGDRHLGRAEDQQHPRRRCGGDAARPGRARTSR